MFVGCGLPAMAETNSAINRRCAASLATDFPARPSSAPVNSSYPAHSPNKLLDPPVPECRIPLSSTLLSIAWKPPANAPEGGAAAPCFRVTHPFHPLFGQSLEVAAQAREWGEERVYYRDRNGRMRFLPVRWTSVAVTDPFVLLAADRAYFRLEDLIRLHDRIKELQG